jgi:uncharacterized protein YkwD
MINDYRVSKGVPALPWTNADYQRAKGVALDNANSKTGDDLAKHLTGQIGYWGGLTPDYPLNWWKDSPGHNVNMLEENTSLAACFIIVQFPDGTKNSVVIVNFTW